MENQAPAHGEPNDTQLDITLFSVMLDIKLYPLIRTLHETLALLNAPAERQVAG